MSESLPTLYQDFIHLSRYARWLPEEKRRETWEETVNRYIDYMCGDLCKGAIPLSVQDEIRQAILNLEVMPSMRCLMTAGPALKRDEAAGYNCSALPIDDPVAFDELFYLLLCGCGVGFSVERQFLAKMPIVADKLRESKSIIVVEDSKIGWANSLRELISMLYQGRIPSWDTSNVRANGTILKTFGGRASGPEPLENMFRLIITIFQKAAGRRLNSIECHDICCHIADSVVVGGVRRCLFLETKVLMATGLWKKIKDVVVGESIIIEDDVSDVSAVFDNGEQEMVEVELEDGSSFKCTKEHRWYVFNHDKDMPEWVQSSDLQNGNYSFMQPEEAPTTT